jgi:competence protein ComEC
MNRKMSKKKKSKLIYTVVLGIVAIAGLLSNNRDSDLKKEITFFSDNTTRNMEVHFIDVGQGDSILIESSEQYMLIDAGNNDDGDMLIEYLQKEGVQKLDYLISTHPHEDHIGGMDDIINNFQVDTIFMPDVEHTTKSFEDVLMAISNQNQQITIPKVGEQYRLGNAGFIIIAPNRADYGEELNNYSIGIKLIHGENSFVMCGDAEELAENDILENGIDISADVYKVSHHGSNTGTTKEFLQAIAPRYAVIECGSGNKYGHPHKETLELFNALNIEVYRTDQNGTVIAKSDGNEITWISEK